MPIAYASSEGSYEPGHPRKIASALTGHIHSHGCEFKISKAIDLGIRFIYHTPVEVCTPTLLHAKISRCSGPKLSAKLVCHSLFGGGGGGGGAPRSHLWSGTANSISSRQRHRVMVHGHV